MRRADRLFEIVRLMRGDRAVKAAALAERLEVSVRTIYRDVADLQASGVPIDGAAGVGYLLRPGYTLPPIMFTPREIEALVVGARMVEAWAGADLSRAAREALSRIAAVVPGDRMAAAERIAVYAPGHRLDPAVRAQLDTIAVAIEARRRIRFDYRSLAGAPSSRTVRPLALHFWGGVWTLESWCELRAAFRAFRVERITILDAAGEPFPVEPGREYSDFIAGLEALCPQAEGRP